MREILFRGIDEGTNEWVYGYYYEKPCEFCKEKGYYIFDDTTISRYNVIPETIGQYTGLTDKNGKKIFEGDICKIKGVPLVDEIPFVVEWNEDYSGWFWRDLEYYDTITPEIAKTAHIIGNIHDNPELLKGGAE